MKQVLVGLDLAKMVLALKVLSFISGNLKEDIYTFYPEFTKLFEFYFHI